MRHLLKIFSFMRNLWPYYVAIIVMSIVLSVLGIATPFILKLATDFVTNAITIHNVDLGPIFGIAFLFFAVDAGTTVVQNWAGYLGDMMTAKLRQQLSERYYAQLLALPQSYYDLELTGKIINRLNRTIGEVTNFINMFANNFFNMYLTLFIGLVVMFAYSWVLAGMLIVLYPLFMWVTAKTSKKWQAWQQEKNLEMDIASGRFAEVVAQIKVVKSFVQEKLEYKEFSNRNQKVVELTRVQSKYWHKMDVLRRIILNVVFFGAVAYIFAYTALGRFTLGDMVLLLQLLTQMRFPIFNMSFIVDSMQHAIAGSKDYFEVMSIEPVIKDGSRAKALKVESGSVTYDNVSFGYTNEQEVLHNVSFDIKEGERVAFVGESGEGKTTLTSLLLRLYDVDRGDIRIGEQSITSVTQQSLRERIAVVFQEPALFSGTIRDNIAYGKPGVKLKDIERAARAANAHDFILKFEKGYDTEIGERGLKLSGGQKQRIAIARAILKDAPILILDEATSSLDSRSEHQVQDALDNLMHGRTTLIIAHRLSTIAQVDHIITLQGGRVDEIGTPEELAKTDGIYGQLLKLQMGSTESAKKKLARYDIAS
ncbi:MAG: ABC transporter ATP-binding protein [Candidatus Saccharimonas sp.]